ncbi:MAG TPA: guanylate kinase [Thermoleophilaceae bacterium]
MPDLAEQDDRRPLAAPAHRARLVPAPLTASRVLVVTGPSGVGKGTLIEALRRRHPELRLAVSATTRQPRSGERPGREYHFLTPEEFDRRLEAGEFLEHATYAGNRYGTLRSEVEKGDAVVLEIELQGARQVRDALPEAVQVFIAPPSKDVLRERLVNRGTDPPETIRARLERAETELEAQDEFPHAIVNDDLERAVQDLVDLVATMWGR